jgi:hypothetical protein
MESSGNYGLKRLNSPSLTDTETQIGVKASTIKRSPQRFPPITLDPFGKYNVSWEVVGSMITFQVTVQTQGFVAFGISNDGKELGADIVAAEVNDDESIDFKVSKAYLCTPVAVEAKINYSGS